MVQCLAFSKIKLVYTEFTVAVVYIVEVNSAKTVVALYIYIDIV